MKLLLPSALALLLVVVPGGQLPDACAQAAMSEAAAPGGEGAEVDPRSFVRVQLPPDSPVEVVDLSYGSSRIVRRPMALEMELNLILTLRNRSGKPVEGLALVLGTAAARGAVGLSAVSGIRLESGATFTLPARMHADYHLASTAASTSARQLPSSMQVRLDAVLFSDGTGYGPDRMRALGAMRINQAESLRDRRFFHVLYDSGGLPRLLSVLQRWGGEATAQTNAPQETPSVLAGVSAERARALAQFADFRVARFSDAPIEIVSARARVFDGGLVDPSLEVRNISGVPVTDFLVTWLLSDATGKEFRGATISASGWREPGTRFQVAPGESAVWSHSSVLAIGPRATGPILSGRVYLRAVEFADGRVWVPERHTIEAAGLTGPLTFSPEVVRLFRLYQTRGPSALLAEFRR